MALVLDRPLFRQRFQEGGAALSFQNLSPEEKQAVARLVMQGVNLEDAIQQVKGVEGFGMGMGEDSGIGLGEMATAAGAGAGAAALSNAALMKMQEQAGPRRLPAPLNPDAGYAERASRAAKDFDFKDAARSTLSSAKEGLGRFARTPIGTAGKMLARGAFGMPGAIVGTAAMLMGGRDSVEDEMKKEAKDRDLDEFFERDPRNYREGGAALSTKPMPFIIPYLRDENGNLVLDENGDPIQQPQENISQTLPFNLLEEKEFTQQLFPYQNYQEGGPVAPPMAGIGSMQQQADVPPDLVAEMEQSSASEMQKVGSEYVGEVMSSIDAAEEPVEMINAIRGNERPIEERYQELASIVGPEDAAATPETVLTLVQPTLMMTEQGALDSGIGQMVQELTQGAEMISEAGEPTDMGMGMGNLMMQGAEQPAMLPPPQNFAMGGGVMAIPHLSDGGEAGFFNKLGNFFSGIIPQGIARMRGPDLGSTGDITKETEDFLEEVRNREEIKPPRFRNVGDTSPTEVELPGSSREAFGSQTLNPFSSAINRRDIVSARVPDIPDNLFGTPYTSDIAAPASRGPVTFKGDAVGMLDRDYGKEGALRESLAQRRDLYRDVLGPTESQQGYQKAQTYFDLAEAAANFAAGRDASGRDVRGLSPAAQAAAAFSGVPGRISERLAEERKAQRAIDLAALESAEKEETARRSQTGRERITAAGIQTQEDLAQFKANFERQEGESLRDFKARILNQDKELKTNLQDSRIAARMQELGYRADLEDISYNNKVLLNNIAKAEQVAYGLDINLNQADARAKIEKGFVDAQLEQTRKLENTRTKLKQNLFESELASKYDIANLDATLTSQQIESRVLGQAWQNAFSQEKFEEILKDNKRDRKNLIRLAELEYQNDVSLIGLRGELAKERDLLRYSFQSEMNAEEWNRIDREFIATRNQWAAEFGLKEDLLDLQKMNERLTGLTLLDELTRDRSVFSDVSGKEGRYLEIASDPDLLRRYSSGDTSERETNEIELAIRRFSQETRTMDPNGNIIITPGVMPSRLQRAMDERIKNKLDVPDYEREFKASPEGILPLGGAKK